ncbi:serine protease precursor [Trichoderma arundinaceum]|uniref:Serine protease n=1 Tax=Trichoderma arundinaceum TaxID=490622 RepID=A0A395NVV4_TRIAR|nr:serine protease precursor [Trichoderma arundinaceum]
MRASTLLALLPLAMAAPSRRASPAPVLIPRGTQLVEGKYIVKMKAEAHTAAVDTAIASIKADADYTYTHSFSGFAASLTSAEIEKLKNDPSVEYIEQDAIVTITETVTQSNADWGLSRISSKEPGTTAYNYDSSAGEGTCAYVVDTGIDVQHPEFEGRAKWLKNFSGDGQDTDGQGHGTHVSGTIAGKTYGVAKKANLFAVKVLDSNGEGTNSAVIAGMDFVAKDAAGQECPKGVVVNMSLGGTQSDAVNQAAASITGAGLFLAVAAGNDGADTSGYSPASEPSVCTVGATEKDDTLASYSNIGELVDILAPGTDITSAWPGNRTNTISGTSMASPHVAGLGAYLLGLGEKVDGLCDTIASSALKGAIQGVPQGTVNLLIQNASQ